MFCNNNYIFNILMFKILVHQNIESIHINDNIVFIETMFNRMADLIIRYRSATQKGSAPEIYININL